jgi:hypothetical protein
MFAVLSFVVLTGIYLFAEHNRISTFYEKLDDRAFTVGQFYLAEDNLSKANFQDVLKKFSQSLPDETIRIYDDHFKPQFIPEGTIHWNPNVLKDVVSQKLVHLADEKRQSTGIYYIDNSGNFIIMVSATDNGGYRYMHDLGLIMFAFHHLFYGERFLKNSAVSHRKDHQQPKKDPINQPGFKIARGREKNRRD